MQVAVWVILFASVFPQRKTQHRRGEQEGEENKTENEKNTKSIECKKATKKQRMKNTKKGDEMELVRLVKYSRKQVPQCSCDVRLRFSHVCKE